MCVGGVRLFKLISLYNPLKKTQIFRYEHEHTTGYRTHDLGKIRVVSMGGDSKLGYVSDPKNRIEESKILNDAGISIRKGRFTGSLNGGQKWFYRKRPMKQPEVAVLFSGQGSQYVSMFDDVACEWPEMRRVLETFQGAYESEDMDLLTEVMYPRASYKSEDSSRDRALTERLKQTKWSQPAIVACEIGVYEILKRAGLSVKFAGGHSLGELSALYVGGYLGDDVKTLAQVVRARAESMQREGGDGAMLAVVGTNVREKIADVLRQESEVWIANENSPDQIVLTGMNFFLSFFSEDLTLTFHI